MNVAFLSPALSAQLPAISTPPATTVPTKPGRIDSANVAEIGVSSGTLVAPVAGARETTTGVSVEGEKTMSTA